MTFLHRLSVHAPPALALLIEDLCYEDLVALLVYALETGPQDVTTSPLVRFLRFHVRRFTLRPDTLLRVAVAQRCCRAARSLMLLRNGPTRRSIRATRHNNAQDPDLAWLECVHPQLYDAEVMDTAARRGDLPLVQWLHTKCDYATSAAMEAAAAAHHLEIAYWLAQNQSTARRPIGGSNPHIRVLASVSTVEDPIAVLHWNTWMPKQDRHGEYNQVYRRVFATRRHLKIEFDFDNTFADDEMIDAMEFAVVHQDHELLKIINDDKCHHTWPQTQEAMYSAARSGDLAVVQWLHENSGSAIDDDTTRHAVRSGSLQLLQWLERREHLSCTTELLQHFCMGGSIESAKWICERWPEVQLDSRSPISLQSDIDAFHYLCSQGRIQPCTWMLSRAAREGRLDILCWCMGLLPDNETNSVIVNVFNTAAMHGHLPIVQYLYERVRARTTINPNAAIMSGKLEVVRFLLRMNSDARRKLPSRYLEHNASYGRFDMVCFLLQNDMVNLDGGKFGAWFKFKPLSSKHRFEVRGLLERGVGTRFDDEVDERETYFEEYVRCALPFQLWRHCDFSLVPLWAAVRGHLDILHTLIDQDYNGVFTKLVVKLLVRHTNASCVVLAILQRRPSTFEVRDNLIRWAVRTQGLLLVRFLVENVTEMANRLKRLHVVALTASRCGHVEVLNWVHRHLASRESVGMCQVNPWRGVLWTALRCGQVDAGKWLLEHSYDDNVAVGQWLELVVVAAARLDAVVGV